MVNSIAISFIIDPIAFVDITINVGELSFTVGTIILPLTFIACAIWPLLFSVSISKTANPLSTESRSGLESIRWSLFPLGIWIIRPVLGNSLSTLLNGEVS